MLHHWYEALNSEVGVAIIASDSDFCLRALYRAKYHANDPLLSELKLLRVGEEIWIVHEKFFTGNKLDLEKVRLCLENSTDP